MSPSNPKQPHIAIINVPALLWASCLSGSTTFFLQFHPTVQVKSTTISEKINLSSVPKEYHKYANVLSKSRAETLALYYPYDL